MDNARIARTLRVSTHAGLLLLLIGAVSWTSGLPFMFPSLGPSAFALSIAPRHPYNRSKRVFGAHAIGVIVGALAYAFIAPGARVLILHAPLAAEELHLIVSATVSVFLTAAAMMSTNFVHPPACATTLIAALGLLPRFFGASMLVIAVAAMIGFNHLYRYVRSARAGG